MRLGFAVAGLSVLAACGGAGGPASTKFPPQPPGCAVSVFPEVPDAPTENIGTVSASCNDVVSDAECLATLKDEVCKLGGNVVWGVPNGPKMDLGRKTFSGRAARTK
jgi:hypothetical protein